jgi:hypothetical protein
MMLAPMGVLLLVCVSDTHGIKNPLSANETSNITDALSVASMALISTFLCLHDYFSVIRVLKMQEYNPS